MLDSPIGKVGDAKDCCTGGYDTFSLGLIKHRPNLKAYACSLARDPDVADDLVQETMARALRHRDKFDCTTNQRAWLFTILKNLFRSKLRKDSREIGLSDGIANSLLRTTADTQENALFLKEVGSKLNALPWPQMKAIILVGAQGYSIDEVASKEGCAPGTIKSRVSRGRSALAKMTSG